LYAERRRGDTRACARKWSLPKRDYLLEPLPHGIFPFFKFFQKGNS